MAKVSISNFSAMYIKYKIVGDENAAVTLTITLPFKEKSIVCDLQTVDKNGLNEILRKFYVEIRNKDPERSTANRLLMPSDLVCRENLPSFEKTSILSTIKNLASNGIFKAFIVLN